MKKEVRYYKSFSDDFESQRDKPLGDGYRWIRDGFFERILSALIYFIAYIVSSVYCRLFLHVSFKGRKKLRSIKGGYFIYANHTQPVGDVFIPALAAFPKRINTVVSTKNYALPIIGGLLPYLGALPIVDSVRGIRELKSAIKHHTSRGRCAVIFPEAHVWEYYTGIRPYPDTSFGFAESLDLPAFCMTATYKKSKIFRRPICKVYIDGPFYPVGDCANSRRKSLCKRIYSTMKMRSYESDYEYIEYREMSESKDK